MSTTEIRLEALAFGSADDTAIQPAQDFWEFMSGTVIARFLDYYWMKHGVSRDTLRMYRTDLIALDRWMLKCKERTLVTATEDDLREFLDARYRASNRILRGLPSLSCIKRFYFYLMEGGFRDDDPTTNVFVRTIRPSRRRPMVLKAVSPS